MTIIGKILKPRLSIFVLDVDGVYSNTKSKKLIHDFKKEKPTISKNKMDGNWRNDQKNYRSDKDVKVWSESIFRKR